MSFWTKPVFRLHMWGDPCGGLTWVPHTENLLLVSALCSFRPTGGKTLILLKIFSLHCVRASEAEVTSHHAMLGYCICWSPASEGSSGVPVQNGMVTCSSRARLHTTDLRWPEVPQREEAFFEQQGPAWMMWWSPEGCHRHRDFFLPFLPFRPSFCPSVLPLFIKAHSKSRICFQFICFAFTAKLSDSDEEIFRGDKQVFFIVLSKIHKHTSVFHALQDSIWKGMKPLQWPCLVSAPFSFLGSIEIILNIFILGSCLLVHKKRK